MMVISLTQRFFLCTETGSESVDIREEKGMFGLVAAALLELELSGCVCIEKKKVRACALKVVRRWRRSMITSGTRGR